MREYGTLSDEIEAFSGDTIIRLGAQVAFFFIGPVKMLRQHIGDYNEQLYFRALKVERRSEATYKKALNGLKSPRDYAKSCLEMEDTPTLEGYQHYLEGYFRDVARTKSNHNEAMQYIREYVDLGNRRVKSIEDSGGVDWDGDYRIIVNGNEPGEWWFPGEVKPGEEFKVKNVED